MWAKIDFVLAVMLEALIIHVPLGSVRACEGLRASKEIKMLVTHIEQAEWELACKARRAGPR